jgi:NADH pyrophosphatase NudC (nudix superfamily)
MLSYCPKCGSTLVQAEVSGRSRLKCAAPACDYVFWDNPVPVVAAVVELDDKVILIHQKGWPEKWVGLVAGFLERDETPEEAILRELREELGLEGEIAGAIGHYSFFQANQLILAFHVIARGEIVLGDELDNYKLIPPEKLRPWALGTGPALRDWLASKKNILVDLPQTPV